MFLILAIFCATFLAIFVSLVLTKYDLGDVVVFLRACRRYRSNGTPMEGMLKCPANYVPLTPISFLEHAALVHGDSLSVVYPGEVTYTWRQTHQRCVKLASSLATLGISRGDLVVALSPNVPAMYELLFAVPMAGAVLSLVNVRYNISTLSILLKKLEPRVIFVDSCFLNTLVETGIKLPHLVVISEESGRYRKYESFLASGRLDFEVRKPLDENDAITMSFTSGTTGTPKGAVYSHRGAYLNALSTVLLLDMPARPVYLWMHPMTHCSAWCLAWGVAARGGTSVILRDVTAKAVFDCVVRYNVSHMGGAPALLNAIANAPLAHVRPLRTRVGVLTGGSTAPAKVPLKMEELGFDVVHSYGASEMYGAATACVVKREWGSLPRVEQAKLRSRQGLRHVGTDDLDVKDPATMESVPADGKTVGEVMVRSNTVMCGYFKDQELTRKAFNKGWYRSGDLGVMHADGYLEIKDRGQDTIRAYGKEAVSTLDIEKVIMSHPEVYEVAVVGKKDDDMGETPCAFVKLREESRLTAIDIIKFCEEHLPRHLVPTDVVFCDVPKTSTGKITKYILKEKANNLPRVSYT